MIKKQTVISCKNLSKSFSSTLAVNNVSLELFEGETLGVLGSSGCGKTTLLRLIAGLETPDKGEIQISNSIVQNSQIHIPTHKRNLGMVFQDYALFPHMTVKQNILFGHQTENKTTTLNHLLELTRLNGLADRFPNELSGGQQQRVALARTLATTPELILMDEPLSNLDASLRKDVRNEINEILVSSKTACIFVTHDKEEAFTISDRVAVMDQGKIEQLDPPDKIYFWPESKKVAILGGTCEFIPGVIEQKIVKTILGDLPLRKPNGFENGTEVSVATRPTDFEITVSPNGRCIVVDKKFTGDENMFSIQLPTGEHLQCKHKIHTSLFSGLKVNLTANPHTKFNTFLP